MSSRFDSDALTRFACTDETRVFAMLGDIDWFGIDLGAEGECGFPVTWREPDLDDEDAGLIDDPNDYERYRLRIAQDDRRAFVAILDHVQPVRWSYFGCLVPDSDKARVTLLLSEYADRDDAEPIVEEKRVGVRVLASASEFPVAVQLRSGGARVAVYVGFADDESACAVIFDGADIGKLSEPRTIDSAREAQTQEILQLQPGTHTLRWQYRYDDFIPNLAPDALPIEDCVRETTVTATIVGELPLPTGRMTMWSSLRYRGGEWQVAANRLEVLCCVGPGGRLVGWSLRVPGAVAQKWTQVGFEDDCCLADSAMDASALPVPPPGGERLLLLEAKAVCVESSELSVATASIGLDEHDRLVSFTVAH